jgi:hypothetical protein
MCGRYVRRAGKQSVMNSTLQLPETGRVKLKVFRWFVLAVAGSERLRTEMTEAV